MSIINRRNTSSRNFVEKWEDLPSGDWLDTDEYGTHWYLANDGTHWFSTDEGYEVWLDEDEKVVEVIIIIVFFFIIFEIQYSTERAHSNNEEC